MKKILLILIGAIIGGGVIACIVLFFAFGPQLNQDQLDTLMILGIIMNLILKDKKPAEKAEKVEESKAE